MQSYAALWCKSNYSFLEGASHPEELVQKAFELGLSAVAITDRDGMYGVVRAHLRARELGVKLVVGSEISLDEGGTVVVLCQTRSGYGRLCRLISTGRLRNPKGISSVSTAEFCEHAKGNIALLPPSGEATPSTQLSRARELKAAFGNRLYIGLSRHQRTEDARQEEQQRRVAEAVEAPLAAVCEVLYHSRERRKLQDVLSCIRHHTPLHEAGTLLKPNAEYALHSPEEFEELFADVSDAVRNNREIVQSCVFSLSELHYRYPSRTLPDGYSTAEWLSELTYRGARKRFSGSIPRAVLAQLRRELDLIEEMEYCGYFLTMWEIVEFCRQQKILCQGRGSAANSIVCYCLGITAIDPVRMDLLFERFISRERAEPPDIDLDIEHGRREEVIQHMYQSYGRAHAAMVANIVRYRMRSAIRDVGKTLGIPQSMLDRLAKLVSHHDSDIRSALSNAGLSAGTSAETHLYERVEEILDFPRHVSIHPGGFLLGAEPVSEIVPVENATMPERTVIQWDKYDVDDMNLFKVDLLGLGALTHLHNAFDLLQQHYGKTLSMASIPAGDSETYSMISRADTVGVFQIESRAQMAMLPQLKPKRFYDLVIQISIIRPGPITGGMVHPYLRRRMGEETVAYPHASLEPILKKTLGVPLFQEQVMRVAMAAADYTPDEADRLRRDMAAWRRSGRLEGHRDMLIERMRKKGIEQAFAEQVFEQIRGFGEYGFPESHAAGFAIVAYSTAWLRCHYPAVFVCALLNAWPMGFYAPATIVADARRHGLTILPIDITISSWECALEWRGSAVDAGKARENSTQPAVRMGLRFVKGLGSRHWKQIKAVRRNAPGTLDAFVRQSRLDTGALSALAKAGAFAAFGFSRREALWHVLGKTQRQAADTRQRTDLHPKSSSNAHDSPRSRTAAQIEWDGEQEEELPNFQNLDTYQRILWDYGTTLHSTEGHPLEPHRAELRQLGFPDAADIAEQEDGARVCYAGLVICRQRPATASGTVFLTLEDESGFVNLIVWEKVYTRYRTVLVTSSFLGITGVLQTRGGTTHIVVDSCFRPKTAFNLPRHESRDFH